MAYFIHNKYDKNSIAKVSGSSGSFTYNDDPSVTVIDYYGLLEGGTDTYKYLDTTKMGIEPVDTLQYANINEGSLIGNTQTTDGKSIIKYASGVSPIIDKIQTQIGETTDTGGSISSGTIMGKLNALSSLMGGFSSFNNFRVTTKSTSGKYGNISYTTTRPAIILVQGPSGNSKVDVTITRGAGFTFPYSSISLSRPSYTSPYEIDEYQYYKIGLCAANSTVNLTTSSSNSSATAYIFEFI